MTEQQPHPELVAAANHFVAATVDREQLAALQVLRVRFSDVEVLEVRPSTPPPPLPAVQPSLLESATTRSQP